MWVGLFMERFKSVGIVGLGQIGGSLALALRGKVALSGFDIDASSREFGDSIGVVILDSLNEIIATCDLLIFAVPADVFLGLLGEVAKSKLNKPLVICDVCSTKSDIDFEVAKHNFDPDIVRYVGLHPLAGNERPGPSGAQESLFVSKTVVVSSGSATDAGSSLFVSSFLIELLGVKILYVDPKTHDVITSSTIDLPHIFAYLASTFANEIRDQSLMHLLSGNSLGDVTRVARSSSKMVASFLFANRHQVVKSLEAVPLQIDKFISALEYEDDTKLQGLLESYAPSPILSTRVFVQMKHSTRNEFEVQQAIYELEKAQILIEALHFGSDDISVSGTMATNAT